MADQFDRAQDLDAYYLNQALEIRAQGMPKGNAVAGLRCVECGDDIPEARRLAVPWCTRCRDCQQEWENDNK
jgi:phage/conjugal plasmid C-4 type zinc finger TraR family protein